MMSVRNKYTLKSYLRSNIHKMQCDVWLRKCQGKEEEVAWKAGVRDEAKKVPLSEIREGLESYAKTWTLVSGHREASGDV